MIGYKTILEKYKGIRVHKKKLNEILLNTIKKIQLNREDIAFAMRESLFDKENLPTILNACYQFDMVCESHLSQTELQFIEKSFVSIDIYEQIPILNSYKESVERNVFFTDLKIILFKHVNNNVYGNDYYFNYMTQTRTVNFDQLTIFNNIHQLMQSTETIETIIQTCYAIENLYNKLENNDYNFISIDLFTLIPEFSDPSYSHFHVRQIQNHMFILINRTIYNDNVYLKYMQQYLNTIGSISHHIKKIINEDQQTLLYEKIIIVCQQLIDYTHGIIYI